MIYLSSGATLPSFALGRTYFVSNNNASPITITAGSGDTINGATSDDIAGKGFAIIHGESLTKWVMINLTRE